MTKPGGSAAGDNPIASKSDDELGRVPVAEAFALDLRDLNADEGYVTALMGPWGSGKTSLVNLIKEQLAADPAVPVIDFNPWMFSGADALVNSFFREISAQLREKDARDLGAVADRLDRYSEVLTPLVWIPGVGPWVSRLQSLTGAAKKFKDKNQKSAAEQKLTVSKALTELERPIIVVVDDIDRLSSQEIQDVFKLVRLTASFPNIIYLLVFDRQRVEEALSADGMPGRSYLEKIVQTGVDLPAVPDQVLLRQIGAALQGVIDGVGGVDLFDESRWPDVLIEVISPLIRNMRDVRRYAASSRSTIQALKEQVDLVDILALEAVRIFLPDVFRGLLRAQAGLTTARAWGPGSNYESPALKIEIDGLLESAELRRPLVEALIKQLFPAGARHIDAGNFGSDWLKIWLKSRRVAHLDVLKLYMERTTTSAMAAFNRAEVAFKLISDGSALNDYMRSLPIEELEEVIGALESFEDEFPKDAVVPASVALTNLLSELPERPRGMFELDTRIVVTRVILRLLRRIDSEDDVKAAVDEILPQLTSLSAKLEIIGTVGHVESLGHKLVSAEQAASLETALAAEIQQADDDSLIGEWDLLRLLIAPARWFTGTTARVIELDSSVELHEAVVRSAISDRRSQSVGNRHVHVTKTLAWDTLLLIYGNEDNIKLVLDKMNAEPSEDNADLRELVAKYLDGWRPDHHN